MEAGDGVSGEVTLVHGVPVVFRSGFASSTAVPGLLWCGVAGLLAWSLLVVGHATAAPAGFWLVLAGIVVVGGVLVHAPVVVIAACTVAGPVVSAWWTAPRGDGDGLWLLVVPSLVVVALASAGVAATLRFAFPALPRRTPRSSPRRNLVVAVSVGVAGALSVGLLLARRPDPYPALERVAASIPVPGTARLTATLRMGDPLCSRGCAPAVEWSYTTDQPARQACRSVATVLQDWESAVARPTEPINAPRNGYYEVCAWQADLPVERTLIAVSDDPGGVRIVHSVFERLD